MAFYLYANRTHELVQAVVSRDEVKEAPRNDFKLFVGRPDREMEIYAKGHPRGLLRLVWSGAVGERVSRVHSV